MEDILLRNLYSWQKNTSSNIQISNYPNSFNRLEKMIIKNSGNSSYPRLAHLQFFDGKLDCDPGARAATEGSIGWEFLIILALSSDSDIASGAKTPREVKGHESKTETLKSGLGPAPAMERPPPYDSKRAAIAPGSGRACKNWGVTSGECAFFSRGRK